MSNKKKPEAKVVPSSEEEEEAPPPPMGDDSEHGPPPTVDEDESAQENQQSDEDDEPKQQFSTMDDDDPKPTEKPKPADRMSTVKTPDKQPDSRPSTTTRTPAKSVPQKEEKKTTPTPSTTATTTAATGRTKIGAPQMVRVVMTDLNNAQFMTLKCDSNSTVEEFSQTLAKKLSLKGKGQVETSHFTLCLNNPKNSRDPKRLAGTQNLISACREHGQTGLSGQPFVVHLTPGQNISAGVSKTIRASFMVNPNVT